MNEKKKGCGDAWQDGYIKGKEETKREITKDIRKAIRASVKTAKKTNSDFSVAMVLRLELDKILNKHKVI